jgi:hypothetical protein
LFYTLQITITACFDEFRDVLRGWGGELKKGRKKEKCITGGILYGRSLKNNIKTVFLALQDEASIQYVAFMNYWTAIHVSSTVVLDV